MKKMVAGGLDNSMLARSGAPPGLDYEAAKDALKEKLLAGWCTDREGRLVRKQTP